MDELFLFIRQLDNIDTENIMDYCIGFEKLINNLDVKLYKHSFGYGYGIVLENMFIIIYKKLNDEIRCVEILINKKFLRIIHSKLFYGVADCESFNDAINYRISDGEKIIYFKSSLIKWGSGSIDWLLDHKPTKLARN